MKQDKATTHRHSRVGGNPQGGVRRPVILAFRQYPQRGDTLTKRGPDMTTRHCGLDPQSRGAACDADETRQSNHQYPLSLHERNHSLSQCLTLEA